MKRLFVILGGLVILGACSGTDDGGGSNGGFGGGNAGGAGGGGGTDQVEVDWETCYLESGVAECATLEMPLDHDDPASVKIPFFVRRIKAEGESRGQLWMLQGGPGYNGSLLALYANAIFLDLGLDIYIPDYRGVGRSAELHCNGRTELSEQCMAALEQKHGEDLVRFSTSDAVRDIGEAIRLFRKPGDEVYVWGSSYGTVTGHRFLHLFPDLANGVVLDSACGAAGCDFGYMNVDRNRNAHEVAKLCAEDPFCASKMGEDPWAKVADVLDRVDAGHCAAGVPDRTFIRPIFAMLTSSSFMPAVGMALIYRLDRCDAADATAVRNLFSVLIGDGSGWVIQDESERSDLLYYHIVLNELWDSSRTIEDFEELERDLVVHVTSPSEWVAFEEWWPWPRYEVPADLRIWADTDLPVLILNGTLDAQTPLERMIDAQDAFTGANQHVVIMPYGTHAVCIGSAPSSSDPKYTCGGVITRQFLRDPTSALDTSCVAEQVPPRFDVANNQPYWFGTTDLYENGQPAKLSITELDDPFLKAQLAHSRASLRRLRR